MRSTLDQRPPPNKHQGTESLTIPMVRAGRVRYERSTNKAAIARPAGEEELRNEFDCGAADRIGAGQSGGDP